MERPEFLSVGDERIFSISHLPERRSRGAGVLFLHPFAEEKLWVGRSSTCLAREIARAGMPVLRFDFRGAGDSDRAHAEMRLASMREDAAAAAAYLRRSIGVETLHLFGFRLGGTLALEFAHELGADSVALVNPLPAGGDYLLKALRSNLTTQMGIFGEVRRDREALLTDMRESGSINIDGYAIASELWDEIGGIDFTQRPPEFAGPGLLLSLVRSAGAQADADSRKLFTAALAGNPASRLETVVSAPIWGEQKRFATGGAELFEPIRDWFARAWQEAAA